MDTSKKIDKWFVTDTDGTHHEYRTQESAERMVEILKGDWDDPRVQHGTLILFDKEPEELYTASRVKELIRNAAAQNIGHFDYATDEEIDRFLAQQSAF